MRPTIAVAVPLQSSCSHHHVIMIPSHFASTIHSRSPRPLPLLPLEADSTKATSVVEAEVPAHFHSEISFDSLCLLHTLLSFFFHFCSDARSFSTLLFHANGQRVSSFCSVRRTDVGSQNAGMPCRCILKARARPRISFCSISEHRRKKWHGGMATEEERVCGKSFCCRHALLWQHTLFYWRRLSPETKARLCVTRVGK